MPLDSRQPLKLWAGVILFFGIGVAIALLTGLALLGRGKLMTYAIIFASIAGAYGAWFVFLIGYRVIRAVRRSCRGKLLDMRMADGSRHFAEIPWRPPLALKQQLLEAAGVKLTEFLDSTTETWIDFEYAGRSFTIHNPLNDYWLFVRDPSCPDAVLHDVLDLLR